MNPGRHRLAISEILGSLIMLAITLIAGAAVFGFVNGQSSSSAQALGNSAASNINFLNEKEVVVSAAMINSSAARIWVYNNGQIDPETMNNVQVFDLAAPNTKCSIEISPPASVDKNKVTSIDFQMPFAPTSTCQSPLTYQSGKSYNFEVIGIFGSTSSTVVQF